MEFQIAKSIGPTLLLQTKLSCLICQHTVNAVHIHHNRPSFMHTSQFIHGHHSFNPVILNTHHQPDIEFQIAKSIGPTLPSQTKLSCLICQHTVNTVHMCHTRQSFTHTSQFIHGHHSFTPVILNTHHQPPIKFQIAKSIGPTLPSQTKLS